MFTVAHALDLYSLAIETVMLPSGAPSTPPWLPPPHASSPRLARSYTEWKVALASSPSLPVKRIRKEFWHCVFACETVAEVVVGTRAGGLCGEIDGYRHIACSLVGIDYSAVVDGGSSEEQALRSAAAATPLKKILLSFIA